MTGDDRFYDALETRDPAERDRTALAAMRAQVALAKDKTSYFGRLLADIDPAELTSYESLSGIPVTRKGDLVDIQAAEPPLGGLNATPISDLSMLFASPGPIFEPQGQGDDYWGYARALYATGFRSGNVIQNCFAYHLTPGGFFLHSGAGAIGCPVIPAGIGNTELQADVMARLKPKGYAGTPDFLKIILEKADEMGLDTSSLTLAHVSGGPLFPPVKAYYESRGIAVFQSYATADLGLVAYETEAHEGLVIDERVILEIVRPGTDMPVPYGDVGEVVVTPLNTDYPLIRFGTGDMSAIVTEPSPCGRTNRRIKGWMGRADQTTKIKGMFVHPKQVADVLARHAEAIKGRLVVDREGDSDRMTLQVEVTSGGTEGLEEAMAATLQSVTKMKGTVALVDSGTLPNDGKVIDDIRKFD